MNLPDLDFIPGAAVMTRVISHPAKGVFTTDLGYSDPAGQRGQFRSGGCSAHYTQRGTLGIPAGG